MIYIYFARFWVCFFRFQQSMCFNSKSSLSAEFFLCSLKMPCKWFWDNEYIFSRYTHRNFQNNIFIHTDFRMGIHCVSSWWTNGRKMKKKKITRKWNYMTIQRSKMIIVNGLFAGTAFTLIAQEHYHIFARTKKKTRISNLSLFEIALCPGLKLVEKCGVRSHAPQNTDFVFTLGSSELENGKYLAKNFLSASIQRLTKHDYRRMDWWLVNRGNGYWSLSKTKIIMWTLSF